MNNCLYLSTTEVNQTQMSSLCFFYCKAIILTERNYQGLQFRDDYAGIYLYLTANRGHF